VRHRYRAPGRTLPQVQLLQPDHAVVSLAGTRECRKTLSLYQRSLVFRVATNAMKRRTQGTLKYLWGFLLLS
jgi:hypothetical protein